MEKGGLEGLGDGEELGCGNGGSVLGENLVVSSKT